jgi:hypothetical protein
MGNLLLCSCNDKKGNGTEFNMFPPNKEGNTDDPTLGKNSNLSEFTLGRSKVLPNMSREEALNYYRFINLLVKIQRYFRLFMKRKSLFGFLPNDLVNFYLFKRIEKNWKRGK